MASTDSQPARGSAAATAALLATSLLASLLVAEGVLRAVLGPPVRFLHPQESYAFDPVVGHVLVPGDGHTHAAPLHVNAAGLRGPELRDAAPSGIRRILALGDSQTFGNGLPFAETWPALLEHELMRAHPDARIEVMNGGLPATDTWQHASLLQRWSDALAPDAVVLAFYVNDVAPRHAPSAANARAANAWPRRIARELKRSAVVSFAWSLWRHVAALRGPAVDRERKLLRGEPDPVLEAGWRQVERSLREMQRLCAARGIPFAIAVLPRRDQVDGRIPEQVYGERIAAIAAGLGIPSIDLLEPLRRAWARDGDALFIAWDGHNSGRANRVIAREISGAFGPLLVGQAELADAAGRTPAGSAVAP